METSTLLSAPEWAKQTFGEVRLGHRSRTQRAVTMAAAIAADPAASLPKQMESEAALHAAYRFSQTPEVSYEQLMRPHVEQTREAMGQQKRVLLIQDTTEVDYQHHPTSMGLGPIGNGTHHGFLLQTVLAIDPASRQVLGIAHPAVLVQHCPLWGLFGAQRRWATWLENLVARLAPCPNLARRRSSRCSTFLLILE